MDTSQIAPPPGFVLDAPPPPEGFVLDSMQPMQQPTLPMSPQIAPLSKKDKRKKFWGGVEEDVRAVGQQVTAIPEAGMALASGIPSYMVGLAAQGGKALYDIWRTGGKGVSFESGKKLKEDIAGIGSYQPKTEGGQALARAATLPFEGALAGLRKGVEVITDDEDAQEGLMLALEIGLVAALPKATSAVKGVIKKSVAKGKPMAVADATKIIEKSPDVPVEVKAQVMKAVETAKKKKLPEPPKGFEIDTPKKQVVRTFKQEGADIVETARPSVVKPETLKMVEVEKGRPVEGVVPKGEKPLYEIGEPFYRKGQTYELTSVEEGAGVKGEPVYHFKNLDAPKHDYYYTAEEMKKVFEPEPPSRVNELRREDIEIQKNLTTEAVEKESSPQPVKTPAQTREIWAGLPYSGPVRKTVTKIGHKIRDIAQIEPQFKEIGAPDTGLNLKTYNSKRNLELEKAEGIAKDLSKQDLSTPDFTELTWISGKDVPAKVLQPKFQESYKTVRNFFDTYKERLKKEGVFQEGFPDDQMRLMSEERMHLNSALKSKKLSKERVTQIREQVKEINETLAFLKKSKVKYVHIPRTWLEGLFENEPVKARGILTEFFAQRKTFDMEALGKYLVEKKFIKPEELDIRRIMGAYAHKAGHKLALADIFNSAKRENLLRLEKDAPKEWQYLPAHAFPSLKGYKAHPVLVDFFERNFTNRGVMVPDTIGKIIGVNVSKILGPIKMMQFYNPIFLPMYDVVQAWWTGSIRSPRTPKNIINAYKTMKNKGQKYWDMHYWGAFSTPFTTDFNSHMKRIQHMVDGTSFFSGVKKYINPYRLSWDLAWTGDHFIRTITNEHYLAKGFSPREAAQLTAKAHADYASIPPATRRYLNKWLFTPSFKISMMSAQAEMVKSAGKYIVKLGKIPKTEKAMAKMLVGLTSGILMRNFVLDKLGFKQDKWGLKYTKEVETDKGKKELVVHISTPDNVFLRFYHRFNMKDIIDDPDSLGTLIDRAKWEFHPLWQWAHEVMSNKSVTFEPVWNKFDPPEKIMKDIGVYTVKRLLRMTELVTDMDTSIQRLAAQKALVKDIGKAGVILNFFSLQYLRNPAEKRAQYKMQQLKQFYKQMEREKPSKNAEQADRRIDQYRKKLQDILDDLEK